MRVTKVETLSCEGGWRTHNFVKITTDTGLVGWSECTMMHSAPMLVAAIKHLGSYVIGQDPMKTEAIQLMLYRITQRQIGGLAHQAISGIDAALLDIKGKALGVPVYQLFGGPVRDKIRVYFTHCGRLEPQNPYLPPTRSAADIPAAAAKVGERGFTAIKTGVGPNAADSSESDEPGDISNRTLDHIVDWIGGWRDALGPNIGIALDVAFRYKMGAMLKLARTLEPFRMMWLESETLDPAALRTVQLGSSTPICIGESFYRTQGFRPYLEEHALDIVMPDTVWNGISMGKKIADYANTYDIMFAPHNSHGIMGGFQAINLCATISNFMILEYEYDDNAWRNDLVSDPLVVEDGYIRIPTKPGLGSDVNEDAVREHPPLHWAG